MLVQCSQRDKPLVPGGEISLLPTNAGGRLCLLPASVDNAMPPQPTDADTNKDDLVNRGSFSKLIDMVASIPRIYGYVSTDVELYKTEDEKEQARRKTFDSMDFKGTDVITVDEWLKFCVEHIIAKAATLAAHPILDHGNVEEFKAFVNATFAIGNLEMYWFLPKLFTKSDPNTDGLVNRGSFSKFNDMDASNPRMYGYTPFNTEMYKTEDGKEQAERKPFDFMDSRGIGMITVDEWLKPGKECIITKVATFVTYPILVHGIEEEFKVFVKAALVCLMYSRDVSPPANANGGAKEGTNVDGCHNVHYKLLMASSPPATIEDEMFPDVSRDVSPSANADGGRYGAKEGAKVDRGHDAHYQLLMASSPSSNYGQQDVSPPANADGGHHGAKEEGEE